MDNEAVRVAVSLRLGLNLCAPHTCQCGSPVDAWDIRAMVCKHASGRFARHHALNDTISRALVSNAIPALKETAGLSRSDGIRPDGLTLIPWQGGRPLVWDVTVATTVADSYFSASATLAGAATETAATRKSVRLSTPICQLRTCSNQLLLRR